VCIPSGAFILGDTLALQDLDRRAQPERVRVVEPFLMDRYEVTVARFRDAIKRGFVPPDRLTPLSNSSATFSLTVGSVCTWSTAGSPTVPAPGIDRETFPLNCVSWTNAHALCQFLGGDLPEEDQWEFAATTAGKAEKTPYPWGAAPLPSCDRTVYSRSGLSTATCPQERMGPIPVNDPVLVKGDVTPLGVVGLAGNVEELLATPFVSYSDVEWQTAGLRALVEEKDAPLRSARGADWLVGSLFSTGSARRAEPVTAAYENVGFRCVRRGR
jgi:formylglycine-generating enzyme required for sulfatase activity